MKKQSASAKTSNLNGVAAPRTLAIDIGGTGIKALTLDPQGKPINDRQKIATPKRATPKAVIRIIEKLAAARPGFERVSAGFPGVVKDGIVYTAANLGKGWTGFDLGKALARKLNHQVDLANFVYRLSIRILG